jgi:hypothetical protein
VTVALALIGGAAWALVPSSPDEVVTADSPETTDASDADVAQGASSPESTGDEAPVAADADPPELLVTCVTALRGEVPSDLKAAIAANGEILELAGAGVSDDPRFGVCSDAINRNRPGTSEWTGVVGPASSSEHYEAVLADGEVSFTEYEAAVRSFMACARDGGVEIQDLAYDEDFQRFPYEYSGGWRSTALVDACNDWHLLQVELEWQRQQGMLDLDPDEATRFMAMDIAESVTRRLGVAIPEGDWVQVRSAWTRYPYGDGPEADDAVFRFMSDFAWMGGDELDISVVNYSPIDPSSRWFFPIVTVTSTDDPDRAAVFVMRWDPDDHDVVIERLPDRSAPPPVVAPEIETTAPGSTLVFDGIGVEGSPAAYVDGVEIEAVSDHEALETVVTLPGELPERFTLTLVIPGPEIPSASVLVLERG